MFSPIRIKQVEIKNRIVLPPMVCLHLADDSGEATARHVAHYEAIARGGCGLIIIEACSVSRYARLVDPQLGIWADAQMEIRRVRIEKAKELLADTRLPFQDVAERAGLKTVSYLCQAFKTVTGTSPGAYRRQFQHE